MALRRSKSANLLTSLTKPGTSSCVSDSASHVGDQSLNSPPRPDLRPSILPLNAAFLTVLHRLENHQITHLPNQICDPKGPHAGDAPSLGSQRSPGLAPALARLPDSRTKIEEEKITSLRGVRSLYPGPVAAHTIQERHYGHRRSILLGRGQNQQLQYVQYVHMWPNPLQE